MEPLVLRGQLKRYSLTVACAETSQTTVLGSPSSLSSSSLSPLLPSYLHSIMELHAMHLCK